MNARLNDAERTAIHALVLAEVRDEQPHLRDGAVDALVGPRVARRVEQLEADRAAAARAAAMGPDRSVQAAAVARLGAALRGPDDDAVAAALADPDLPSDVRLHGTTALSVRTLTKRCDALALENADLRRKQSNAAAHVGRMAQDLTRLEQRREAGEAFIGKVAGRHNSLADDVAKLSRTVADARLDRLASQIAEGRDALDRATVETRQALERHSTEGIRTRTDPDLVRDVVVTDADGTFHRISLPALITRLDEMRAAGFPDPRGRDGS